MLRLLVPIGLLLCSWFSCMTLDPTDSYPRVNLALVHIHLPFLSPSIMGPFSNIFSIINFSQAVRSQFLCWLYTFNFVAEPLIKIENSIVCLVVELEVRFSQGFSGPVILEKLWKKIIIFCLEWLSQYLRSIGDHMPWHDPVLGCIPEYTSIFLYLDCFGHFVYIWNRPQIFVPLFCHQFPYAPFLPHGGLIFLRMPVFNPSIRRLWHLFLKIYFPGIYLIFHKLCVIIPMGGFSVFHEPLDNPDIFMN